MGTMTETEKKALALLNEHSDYEVIDLDEAQYSTAIQALCRAIEQHEAFKREVSDSIEHYLDQWRHSTPSREVFACQFGDFIIAKPVDPFVALVGEAVWNDPNEPDAVDCAASILAALAARGLKIVEVDYE